MKFNSITAYKGFDWETRGNCKDGRLMNARK